MAEQYQLIDKYGTALPAMTAASTASTASVDGVDGAADARKRGSGIHWGIPHGS